MDDMFWTLESQKDLPTEILKKRLEIGMHSPEIIDLLEVLTIRSILAKRGEKTEIDDYELRLALHELENARLGQSRRRHALLSGREIALWMSRLTDLGLAHKFTVTDDDEKKFAEALIDHLSHGEMEEAANIVHLCSNLGIETSVSGFPRPTISLLRMEVAEMA